MTDIVDCEVDEWFDEVIEDKPERDIGGILALLTVTGLVTWLTIGVDWAGLILPH